LRRFAGGNDSALATTRCPNDHEQAVTVDESDGHGARLAPILTFVVNLNAMFVLEHARREVEVEAAQLLGPGALFAIPFEAVEPIGHAKYTPPSAHTSTA